MKPNSLLIALFLLLSTITFAQKKQTQTSNVKPTNAITGIASFIGNDLEVAMISVNEFLLKKNLNVTKLEENVTYNLDDNLLKTNEIATYSKKLLIGEGTSLEFTSNADKKIKIIEIVCSGDKATQTKLTTDLGIQNWEIILSSNGSTIKKKANLRANMYNSEEYMYTTIEEPFSTQEYLKSKVPFDSLKVTSSWNAFAGTLLQKATQGTTKFLYATSKKTQFDDAGNFDNRFQEFYFTNGISMTIYQEKNKHIMAYFSTQNPVIYSSFKKNFIPNTLNSRYKFGEGNMYRIEHVMLHDSPENNRLIVYTLPSTNDDNAKLAYNQIMPDISTLNYYYDAFENNPNELRLFLQDHFKMADEGNRIEFTNNKGNTVIGFHYNTKNSDYWGLKLVVDYYDSEIINQLKADAEDSELTYQDYTVSGKTFNRTQFYDKTTYNAYKTGNDIKKQADKIAQQKREAEELKQQIEEDKRKAQRNAEWQGVINQATNDLIKIFGK